MNSSQRLFFNKKRSFHTLIFIKNLLNGHNSKHTIMKNFETILNTGQDAANYIEVENPNEIILSVYQEVE